VYLELVRLREGLLWERTGARVPFHKLSGLHPGLGGWAVGSLGSCISILFSTESLNPVVKPTAASCTSEGKEGGGPCARPC
jgi:hypothetical protein